MTSKIAIVGGGTFGNAFAAHAQTHGCDVDIIKGIKPTDLKILDKYYDGVVVTAQSHQPNYFENNNDLYFVNTDLPIRIVKECIALKIKNLAIFSTGSVYEQQKGKPALEGDQIRPENLSDYAHCKAIMEQLVLRSADHFDALKVLRPFMMYGKGLPKARLLARLPDIIRREDDIVLGGGKGIVCNPIHVNDAAKFVFSQLFSKGHDIYNLCGEEVLSLKEIAVQFGKLLNLSPKFIELDGDYAYVVGNNQKALSAGLEYTTSLKEGLKDLLTEQTNAEQVNDKRNIHIALPCLGNEEWLATRDPIKTGWLTQGPKVAAFETKFADMHGVHKALATTSCTTGLHLALAAYGIGPGDEVIVPAFTWVATANVVLYCGATPIFADVDPVTYNMNIDDAVSKVTHRTKAIIPVHLFGLCVDIAQLQSKLPSHIKVIEDAACAAGAMLNGQYAGGLGDAAAFSFHPRKSITTGEGGMLTSNDKEFIILAEKLRNHGAEVSEEQRHAGPRPYLLPDFNMLGFNYRMTDLQGAVGLVQLDKLTGFITERAQWAEYYRENLSDVEWLRLPQEPKNGKHAWQAFVTYVDPERAPMPRNQIMDLLQQNGIATRPGTHAVHMLDYYKNKYSLKDSDFEGARLCDQNTMAIPLHNRMVKEDYDYIIKTIKQVG